MSRGELLVVYKNYSDYDLLNDLARARQFIQAGRMLLGRPVRRSASGGRGGEEVELEPRIMQEEVKAAVAWYHARSGAVLDPRQLVPDDDFRG